MAELKNAFSTKNVVVKTPMLVPSYDSWLEKAIDKKFSRLHKGDQTQHSWRFEAVQKSDAFPNGCKTTYKAYSSDVVVEIKKVNPLQCRTPMGRSVGLEPYRVYNTWQPEAYGKNSPPARRHIEGTYLLKHWDTLIWNDPGPDRLETGSMESLRKTVQKVKETEFFHPSGDHKDDYVIWRNWKDIFVLPEKKDVLDETRTDEYLLQLQTKGKLHRHPDAVYRSPLNLLIFRDASNENVDWEINTGLERVNPEFEYPAVFQMATNSVVMEDNPNPGPPRYTAESDVMLSELIDEFEAVTGLYYTEVLPSRSFKKEKLQSMIRRCLSYEVVCQSVTGNKPDLIEKLLSWGSSFVSLFLRSVSNDPATKFNIDKLMFGNLQTITEQNRTVLALGNVTGTRNISAADAKSFSADGPITENALLGLLDLFQNRDSKIALNHVDVHADTDNYRLYKRSKFLPPQFITQLTSDNFDVQEVMLAYFVGINMRDLHTVYTLFELGGRYVLLFISIDEQKFFFIDPRDDVASAVPVFVVMTIVPKFKELCLQLQLDCNNWNVENYPYRYSKLALEGNIYDGVCILSVLYFRVMDIPIFFNDHSLVVARENFCAWLCIFEELPY